MENIDFYSLFQGFGTMAAGGWLLATARIVLIFLGFALIYLGWKGILEPMIMIPMGLGMIAINCGTLFMPEGGLGNLFLDPMLTDTDELMNTMQIDFLQPIYTFTFSNGLIACFVFMGIGTLLDVGYLLQRPVTSIFLALCAELGTFLTIPIAASMGLSLKESASVAMVGGAGRPDGIIYLSCSGKTSVRTDHGGSLSVSGINLRRLSLSCEIINPATLTRHQDESDETGQELRSQSKISLCSHPVCCIMLSVPGSLPALFLSVHRGCHTRVQSETHTRFHKRPTVIRFDFYAGCLTGCFMRRTSAIRPESRQTIDFKYRCIAIIRYRRNYRRIHHVFY